jgi:hypothetical protein
MFPVKENKQQYMKHSESRRVLQSFNVQMELFGMTKFRQSGEENSL